MMKRKSQGLSLNMVVVGAIAIVVLVVIVLIFTTSMGNVEKRVMGEFGCCVDGCANPVNEVYKNSVVLGPADKGDFDTVEEACVASITDSGKAGEVYRAALSDVQVGSGEICCLVE